MRVLGCRYVWVSQKSCCCPHLQINWERKDDKDKHLLIYNVWSVFDRKLSQLLNAEYLQKPLAIIRAQFFDKEFVFWSLKLENGLLPFCYMLKMAPQAEGVCVYAMVSCSVCEGVCQTCGWRWRHGLSSQCFCCASYCVDLGTSVPSLVGFLPLNSQPPARTSKTKNPLQTTHAFTFNDVSHIPLHYDGWRQMEVTYKKSVCVCV